MGCARKVRNSPIAFCPFLLNAHCGLLARVFVPLYRSYNIFETAFQNIYPRSDSFSSTHNSTPLKRYIGDETQKKDLQTHAIIRPSLCNTNYARTIHTFTCYVAPEFTLFSRLHLHTRRMKIIKKTIEEGFRRFESCRTTGARRPSHRLHRSFRSNRLSIVWFRLARTYGRAHGARV